MSKVVVRDVAPVEEFIKLHGPMYQKQHIYVATAGIIQEGMGKSGDRYIMEAQNSLAVK